MKKVLTVFIPVLLLVSALFLSCVISPETGLSDGDAVFAGGVIYEIEESEPMLLSLPDNAPWNFQRLVPFGEGVSLSSGDIVSLNFTATSDLDIGYLKLFLVDQKASGADWNVISEYYDAYSGIVAGEEFTFSFDIPVKANAGSDNIKLGIIAEYDAVESKPTLTFTTLTATQVIE